MGTDRVTAGIKAAGCTRSVAQFWRVGSVGLESANPPRKPASTGHELQATVCKLRAALGPRSTAFYSLFPTLYSLFFPYQMTGIMPDFFICSSWVTSGIPSTSAVAPIKRS